MTQAVRVTQAMRVTRVVRVAGWTGRSGRVCWPRRCLRIGP